MKTFLEYNRGEPNNPINDMSDTVLIANLSELFAEVQWHGCDTKRRAISSHDHLYFVRLM